MFDYDNLTIRELYELFSDYTSEHKQSMLDYIYKWNTIEFTEDLETFICGHHYLQVFVQPCMVDNKGALVVTFCDISDAKKLAEASKIS